MAAVNSPAPDVGATRYERRRVETTRHTTSLLLASFACPTPSCHETTGYLAAISRTSRPTKSVSLSSVSGAAGSSMPGRPITSNFRDHGFTTFLDAGVPNDLLERAIASVEGRVLNEIRTIGADRRGPQQKADVANLFAIHLVRSPAFKSFHRFIGDRFREEDVTA